MTIDKFSKISIAILIISVPLQIVSIYVGFSVLLIRLIFIICLSIYIVIMLNKGNFKLPHTFLNIYILSLICVNMLISLLALDIILSLKSAFLFIFIILFFGFCITLIRSKEILNFTVNTYIYTALFIALFGIFQQISFIFGWNLDLPFIKYFSYHETALLPSARSWAVEEISPLFQRIRGTFLDSNIFAAYILSALGLSFTKLIYSLIENIHKNIVKYFLFSIIFLLTIFLTMSRSALIGLLLLLLVIAFYYNGEFIKTYLYLKLITYISLSTLTLTILFPDLFDLIKGVIDSFIITENFSSQRNASALYHLLIYNDGLKMFWDHPITGVGLSNFRIEFINYESVWKTGYTNFYMMAHSTFLSFFVEGGIIGALANFSIITAIIFKLHRRIKFIRLNHNKATIVGIFSSYIGVLGCNIFYQFYLTEFVWLITAMTIASYYLIKENTNGRST